MQKTYQFHVFDFNANSEPVLPIDFSGGDSIPETSIWTDSGPTPPARNPLIQVLLYEGDTCGFPCGDEWIRIEIVGGGEYGGYLGFYKVTA